MLACARIGAPHTVVFGGFLGRCPAWPDRGLRRAGGDHRGTAATARARPRRSSPRWTPPWRSARMSAACWWCAAPARRGVDRGPGRVVARLVAAQSAEHEPERSTASTRSTSCTPRHHGQAQGHPCTPPAATSPRSPVALGRLRRQAGTGRVLDRGPTSAGHRPLVHRVGPLANGVTSVLYEGTPDTPHQGRWWRSCRSNGVSILYCAPTRSGTFMKWGEEIRPATTSSCGCRLGR